MVLKMPITLDRRQLKLPINLPLILPLPRTPLIILSCLEISNNLKEKEI